ncbi:MAG: hypothetical protein IJ270_00675 [Paludibacteraceae bacterium]|nr:hypothetical protein [Paludibacteraceae bacterium]
MKKIVILLGFASLLLACKEQRLYKDGKNNGEEYCNCILSGDSIGASKINKVALKKMDAGEYHWLQGFAEIRDKKCPQ